MIEENCCSEILHSEQCGPFLTFRGVLSVNDMIGKCDHIEA